jgi:hypothetical protein
MALEVQPGWYDLEESLPNVRLWVAETMLERAWEDYEQENREYWSSSSKRDRD